MSYQISLQIQCDFNLDNVFQKTTQSNFKLFAHRKWLRIAEMFLKDKVKLFHYQMPRLVMTTVIYGTEF